MNTATKWKEFDSVKDEALLDWLHERWNGQKGGMTKIQDLPFKGEAGLLRWGSLRSTLLWMTVSAWFWSSGMTSLVALGAAIAILPNGRAAARSLLSGGDSWKKARETGSGRLAAFGALCERQALAIASTAPVPLAMAAPYKGIEYGRNGLAYAQQKLAKWGQEKASQALTKAVDRVDDTLEFLAECIEGTEDWQAGLLVKIAHRDGASAFQSLEIYDELARLRMQCRWDVFNEIRLCELENKPGQSSKGLISDHERTLLSLTLDLVDQKQLHSESLPLILEKIEAAGVPAWFKPRPGMPMLLEMARSVAEWHHYHFNEMPSDGIQKMQAALEARDIQGVVGEAYSAAGAKPRAGRVNRL